MFVLKSGFLFVRGEPTQEDHQNSHHSNHYSSSSASHFEPNEARAPQTYVRQVPIPASAKFPNQHQMSIAHESIERPRYQVIQVPAGVDLQKFLAQQTA